MLQLKTSIMEIKDAFDRLIGKSNMAEGIISEVGDISLEIPKLKNRNVGKNPNIQKTI